MYVSTISKTLSLGATFPRVILYRRQNAIRMGLIRPEIILVILACKLYIRNLRGKTRNGKLIWYHEKMIIVKYGIGKFESIENLSMNKSI